MSEKQKQGSIVVNGVTYDLTVTMGAFLEFKRLTGREASAIKSDDLSDTLVFIYCIAKSSARRNGAEFPFADADAFADCLTPEEMATLSLEL